MPPAPPFPRGSLSITDRAWRRWAELDPYHGVLGRGYDEGAIADSSVRQRFFDEGERHIEQVLRDLAMTGSLRSGQALDFGCGVGRLAIPLSRRFARVTGVDVSPEMLRIAAENSDGHGNLRWVETLEDATAGGTKFDLVHSYIVLQHIRVVQGTAIIRQLIDAVASGGAFALHVNIADNRKTRRVLNFFRYRIPPLNWAYNVATRKRWNLPISEMHVYDSEMIIGELSAASVMPLMIRRFANGGYVGYMFIGRRPD